jgi:hypothetical protein
MYFTEYNACGIGGFIDPPGIEAALLRPHGAVLEQHANPIALQYQVRRILRLGNPGGTEPSFFDSHDAIFIQNAYSVAFELQLSSVLCLLYPSG